MRVRRSESSDEKVCDASANAFVEFDKHARAAERSDRLGREDVRFISLDVAEDRVRTQPDERLGPCGTMELDRHLVLPRERRGLSSCARRNVEGVNRHFRYAQCEPDGVVAI